MITFSHLTKQFGNYKAVDDLSFEVAPHQAMALWGPNGAGKTTVIKCLLGLLTYEGRFGSMALMCANKGETCVMLLGYVPQELAFYEEMNTLEMTDLFCPLEKGAIVLR